MAGNIALGTIAEIEKQGLAELKKILASELPRRVVKQGVKKAAQKAMVPVAKTARKEAPVHFGFLKKSFAGKAKSYRDGRLTISLVGVNAAKEFLDPSGNEKKPGKYLHLVLAHNDFMTPALENNADQVKAIFFSIVQDEVMKASAEFNARAKK
jgi:hypothetical protein